MVVVKIDEMWAGNPGLGACSGTTLLGSKKESIGDVAHDMCWRTRPD